MAQERIAPSPIPILTSKQTPRPHTPDEIDQALFVRIQVTHLEIIDTRFIINLDGKAPQLLIRYRGADAPEPFWASWLYVRIVVGSGQNWFARFAAYIPNHHELHLAPLHDELEEYAACQAIRSQTPVTHLRLGARLATHTFTRDFHLGPHLN